MGPQYKISNKNDRCSSTVIFQNWQRRKLKFTSKDQGRRLGGNLLCEKYFLASFEKFRSSLRKMSNFFALSPSLLQNFEMLAEALQMMRLMCAYCFCRQLSSDLICSKLT